MKRRTEVNEFLNIEELTWADVRSDVKKINPELANVIDKLSPSNKYTFHKAKYRYGDSILKDGKIFLPLKNGKLVELFDAAVPTKIQQKLSYNSPLNPVLFPLEKGLELFISLQDRVIPYFVMRPGNLIGVWKVLDYKSYEPSGMWQITAGSRSIFMLPKISENIGHDRLRRIYNFTLDKPIELRDHWDIFREISRSENFKELWEVPVLFFSKEWFENIHDKSWSEFKLFLLDFNWRCSDFWRSQYVWDLTFSRIESIRNMKPSPYYADIVKHLFAIAVGAVLGFSPALNDEQGPIKRIKEIYTDEYGLKISAPIIMQPTTFSMNDSIKDVFVSLQYLTPIKLSLKSSKRASVISDTHMISALLEKYVTLRQDCVTKFPLAPCQNFC